MLRSFADIQRERILRMMKKVNDTFSCKTDTWLLKNNFLEEHDRKK